MHRCINKYIDLSIKEMIEMVQEMACTSKPIKYLNLGLI